MSTSPETASGIPVCGCTIGDLSKLTPTMNTTAKKSDTVPLDWSEVYYTMLG